MPIGRVGRPGLLGTMARTAVIAGTANAVGRGMNRVAASRAQTRDDAQAYREQQAAPPPAGPAAAPVEDDMVTELKKLGDLHAAGVITDEEFTAAKAKLLSLTGSPAPNHRHAVARRHA